MNRICSSRPRPAVPLRTVASAIVAPLFCLGIVSNTLAMGRNPKYIPDTPVSKDEAIRIATQFIRDKGYRKDLAFSRAYVRKLDVSYRLPDGSEVYQRPVTGPYTKKRVWEIVFPSKRVADDPLLIIKFPELVVVNADTGQVEGAATLK